VTLDPTNLHATCVDIDGRGVLILGPSGAGKSTLAIQLITLGARLVSDDRCCVIARDGVLIVTRPATLPKGIEARGIGILNAPMCDETQVCYVLDLERAPASRYPDPQSIEISGVHIPVISKTGLDGFTHSLYLLLKYGQINDL
jgi:HPr kinase/phosphorylase